MRVLVIGAGVIGSVYAGHLAEAGHDVALVARGSRLNDLIRSGLTLRRSGWSGRPTVTFIEQVPATPRDLVIIAVRREQAMVAAAEASRAAAATVMLFGNFAGMTAELRAAVGTERALAGIPGVGGKIEAGGAVSYALITQQPTVVGTIGGPGESAEPVAATLRQAGLQTAVERDIEGWLASHAALVVPMAGAIRAAGGQADALAGRKDLLRLAVGATGAIYRAQRNRGRLVVNGNLRLLYLRMPAWFAVRYWSRALRGEFGELAFAAHTRHAWGEMAMLGSWLRSSIADDHAAAAALDQLMRLANAAPS
jgi:2-dehydropantoate 2-reductase